MSKQKRRGATKSEAAVEKTRDTGRLPGGVRLGANAKGIARLLHPETTRSGAAIRFHVRAIEPEKR